MTIEEQVNEGIKNAMKAKDKVRLETMRNIKKVILEAKTKPGANDQIDDAECIKQKKERNQLEFTNNKGARICFNKRWDRWQYWKSFCQNR